jgi:hypothetical protein
LREVSNLGIHNSVEYMIKVNFKGRNFWGREIFVPLKIK